MIVEGRSIAELYVSCIDIHVNDVCTQTEFRAPLHFNPPGQSEFEGPARAFPAPTGRPSRMIVNRIRWNATTINIRPWESEC